MEIQFRDRVLKVHAVIAIKDKQQCLAQQGGATVHATFCTDIPSVKMALESHYEPLCFVFPDGSVSYIVKREQLARAEEITLSVADMARIRRMKRAVG